MLCLPRWWIILYVVAVPAGCWAIGCCTGRRWKVVCRMVRNVRQVGVCVVLLRRVCCDCGWYYSGKYVRRIVVEL